MPCLGADTTGSMSLGPSPSQRGDRMRGEQTDRTASIAVCAPQCGLCIRAGIKPGLYA